jgi:parallel beta helix pectate lyase-like protein/type IX secretion system substrate protein
MKKILVLVCVLLSMYFTLTAIDVSGPVSGLWVIGDSPYTVTGDLSIIAGTTLTIQEDVVIEFQDDGPWRFDVFGTLLTEGTAGNEITFTAEDSSVGWNGIRFMNITTTGQVLSELVYCDFEFGLSVGLGALAQGGAIYCIESSDLLIQNCSFENCTAASGGAIYLEDSAVTIEDTSVESCTSTGAGGGIYIQTSDAILNDVQVIDNDSGIWGGGIFLNNADPVLTHVLIADNTSSDSGGGICAYNYSQPELTNLTVSNNLSNWPGSGIACLYNSNVTLLNSIVWNNDNSNVYVNTTSEVSIDYSDIQGGEQGVIDVSNNSATINWGTGNIDADPDFISAATGDYALEATSVCINAGDPNELYDDPDNTRNDMGAFYFYQTGITGMVMFESVNDPSDIEDILITVTGTANTTTNPNALGTYFVALSAGTYNVVASLDGYSSDPLNYTGIVVLDDVLITDIDFEMSLPTPGHIQGRVALNGAGSIPSVEITAGDVTVYPYWIDATPTGYYVYDLVVPPGAYDVTAKLDGFQDSTYTAVPVNSNPPTEDIDFILEPQVFYGNVSGTISVIGGGDLTGITVYANNESATPDPVSGFYTLTTTTGLCDVHASKAGHAIATFSDVTVYPNPYTVTDIDMSLLAWDIISGTSFSMILYATASLEGEFVTNMGSTQLAAFGPDGSGGTECRGTAIWVDGSHPLWETTTHYWQLPGYWYINIVSNNDLPGTEQISFRLFDSETTTVHTLSNTITFTENQTTSMDQEYTSTNQTQVFDLTLNWNWISLNLKPAITTPDAIFDPLVPPTVPSAAIQQVKYDDVSRTYLGSWGGDYLNVSEGDGILINMLSPVNPFNVVGQKINPIIKPLYLVSGWNWLGFLPQNSMSVQDALESIEASVDVIKSQNKSLTNIGGSWIGDLLTLTPGESYKVKLTAEAIFTYPSNVSTRSDITTEISKKQPEHWSLLQSNKSNMIVMATIQNQDDDKLIDDNYAIGVFDEAGECRSVGYCENDFWYFTVVGNDESDVLHFRVYDTVSEEEIICNDNIEYISDSIMGSSTEPITIRFNSDTPDAPVALKLGQNHPNPFNPVTSISYSIPEGQIVKLSIFNTKGQHVCDLVDGYKEAGNHQEIWDATKYSSGVYFYKLTSSKESLIKKALLIK